MSITRFVSEYCRNLSVEILLNRGVRDLLVNLIRREHSRFGIRTAVRTFVVCFVGDSRTPLLLRRPYHTSITHPLPHHLEYTIREMRLTNWSILYHTFVILLLCGSSLASMYHLSSFRG